LKRLVLPSSQRQWEQTYSDHLTPPIPILCGMQLVRLPPRHHEQHSAAMYESANGQMTVTSQQSALSFCQGTRVSQSGRFPSERDKPVGSLATGKPAAEKLRTIRSFREWCLIVLLGAFLQTKLWRPRASTIEPQRHSCGEHKSSPSL